MTALRHDASHRRPASHDEHGGDGIDAEPALSRFLNQPMHYGLGDNRAGQGKRRKLPGLSGTSRCG